MSVSYLVFTGLFNIGFTPLVNSGLRFLLYPGLLFVIDCLSLFFCRWILLGLDSTGVPVVIYHLGLREVCLRLVLSTAFLAVSSTMVFFTLFATLDSVLLLFAMWGMLGSSAMILKAIADIEHDLINTADFTEAVKMWGWLEYVFIVLNVCCLLPFVGEWWMCLPQLGFTAIKFLRLLTGAEKFDESKIYNKKYYEKQRKWHITGLFFYLISSFIYFARFMTSIMDIHVHGISPYD